MALRLINACLSSGVGGEQVAFLRYNNLLQALGHDVTVCVRRRAAIAEAFEGVAPAVALAAAFEFDPRTILRAAHLIVSRKPHAVLAHSRRTSVAFAAAIRLLSAAVPLIRVLHRPSFKGIEQADAVICVCPGLAAEAKERIGNAEKVVCIPNFVPHSKLPGPEAPRPEARAGIPVIGFCGRFVPEKGLGLFLRALCLLRSQGHAFRVVIAGDGPLRDELMGSADAVALGDAVQWCGWIKDTARFFQEIDFLVLPSLSEAFGLVTIEAFAASKPVVATKTLGSGWLIRHGQNGLLADFSAQSIAEEMSKMLGDRGLMSRLGEQAQCDVRQFHSDSVARSLDDCIHAVVNRIAAAQSGIHAAAG